MSTLAATLVLAGLGAFEAGPPHLNPVICRFRDDTDSTMTVRLAPDTDPAWNGGWRVTLHLNGQTVPGAVAPLDRTRARDVVLRAVDDDRTAYLIALRDNGLAMMRYRGTSAAVEVNMQGACEGHMPAFEVWLGR
ncbi:hypothetical protein DXV76_09445 [Rhodobacteraceae bacterium CCMM004]|nr:hypothetical protein DXV76_09445 [Rhodobacteraceae bacterium CCMM004]